MHFFLPFSRLKVIATTGQMDRGCLLAIVMLSVYNGGADVLGLLLHPESVRE